MYSKETIKKEIFQRYSIGDIHDDFFKLKINQEYVPKKDYKRIITNIAAVVLISTILGGVSYAFYNHIIKKAPNFDYFKNDKIKFTDDYRYYTTEINEVIAKSDTGTEVTLCSTNYDGAFTVFELNVRFSQEDKEYFKLGERTFTDEEVEANPSLNKELRNGFEIILFNDGNKFVLDNETFYIDDSNRQTIEKIDDYNYKVYYYIFIPDEIIDDKASFTISINDFRIIKSYDRNTIDVNSDNSSIVVGKSEDLYKIIDMHGEYDCYFLNKPNENSKIYYYKFDDIVFENRVQTLEYVKVTPMQTIIKIKSVINNITNFEPNIPITEIDNPELISFSIYNVYDEEGKKLDSSTILEEKVIEFEDGHKEYYTKTQIGPEWNQSNPFNQTMTMIDYVIVSNNDYSKELIIHPTISQHYDFGAYAQYFEEIKDCFDIIIE